jgi:hypothetical protein
MKYLLVVDGKGYRGEKNRDQGRRVENVFHNIASSMIECQMKALNSLCVLFGN